MGDRRRRGRPQKESGGERGGGRGGITKRGKDVVNERERGRMADGKGGRVKREGKRWNPVPI